jgi:hypothetical protein
MRAVALITFPLWVIPAILAFIVVAALSDIWASVRDFIPKDHP